MSTPEKTNKATPPVKQNTTAKKESVDTKATDNEPTAPDTDKNKKPASDIYFKQQLKVINEQNKLLRQSNDSIRKHNQQLTTELAELKDKIALLSKKPVPANPV